MGIASELVFIAAYVASVPVAFWFGLGAMRQIENPITNGGFVFVVVLSLMPLVGLGANFIARLILGAGKWEWAKRPNKWTNKQR